MLAFNIDKKEDVDIKKLFDEISLPELPPTKNQIES